MHVIRAWSALQMLSTCEGDLSGSSLVVGFSSEKTWYVLMMHRRTYHWMFTQTAVQLHLSLLPKNIRHASFIEHQVQSSWCYEIYILCSVVCLLANIHKYFSDNSNHSCGTTYKCDTWGHLVVRHDHFLVKKFAIKHIFFHPPFLHPLLFEILQQILQQKMLVNNDTCTIAVKSTAVSILLLALARVLVLHGREPALAVTWHTRDWMWLTGIMLTACFSKKLQKNCWQLASQLFFIFV